MFVAFKAIKIKSISFINCVKFSTKIPIKTIEFKTCGPLYDKLRKTKPKLYQNCPSDGLDVNVEYVDTFADNPNKNVKTIVAIHGNPGHHKHFKNLIDYFSSRNVRVIVPNMPDFSITRKTLSFWHSNEERSQFILDFLKAINVLIIDCLVSHSVGIHPISLIWTEPRQLTIRSIGLFSPQYLPERFFIITRILSVFCMNKWGISLMDRYKPHITAKVILPVSFSNVDEVLCFFALQSQIKNKDYYKLLDKTKQMEIPTLVVYGQRDKAIPKDDYQEFVQRLGADNKDLIEFNDNTVEANIGHQNWIKVLSFKSGGHFCYAKYNQQVNRHLAQHCLKL